MFFQNFFGLQIFIFVFSLTHKSIGKSANCANCLMNRRWICNDVWMDILPSFDHAQLGLKLALLSYRFDVLVDTHFNGKSELTIWNWIIISKDGAPKPKLSVRIDAGKFVDFPLPCRPLPNKIRFCCLRIDYIDHSVLTFLRTNKHIWDRNGTKFDLYAVFSSENNVLPIWDVFVRQICPIFATNIHHLGFICQNHLDTLCRHISPTFLTDCTRLHSVFSNVLCPDVIVANHDQFDEPNATAGQALSKWLHTPTTNGQPKRFRFDYLNTSNFEWVNNFKGIFLRATTSAVSYIIRFVVCWSITQIEPFELENERTKEKLTLKKDEDSSWLLKRCPIIGETAIKWENDKNLNNVKLNLWAGNNYGPLSPPTEEEADESNENDA